MTGIISLHDRKKYMQPFLVGRNDWAQCVSEANNMHRTHSFKIKGNIHIIS
jgi:hypothetical protein